MVAWGAGPLAFGLVLRMTSLPILQRIQQRLQSIEVGGFGEMEIKSGGLPTLKTRSFTGHRLEQGEREPATV